MIAHGGKDVAYGQVSHDDKGRIVCVGDMETQMRQTHANVQKMLAQYTATTVSPLLRHRELFVDLFTSPTRQHDSPSKQ